MQTQIDLLNDSPTEVMDLANLPVDLPGDDAVWFGRIQTELQRLRKSRKMGSFASQLHYILRQIRVGAVLRRDRLEAVDALLVTYHEESCDEAACSSTADEWAAKWARRLRAFVGADPRERDDGPWQPDLPLMQRQARVMMDDILEEMQREKEAASAQLREDQIMAAALGASSSPFETSGERPGGQSERGNESAASVLSLDAAASEIIVRVLMALMSVFC